MMFKFDINTCIRLVGTNAILKFFVCFFFIKQRLMTTSVQQPKNVGYWYFGGISSAMAAACTHPLDLIKVHLQTQQQRQLGMFGMGIRVIKQDGVLALYNGISASILRQLTYSLTRFGIYAKFKELKQHPIGFVESCAAAMFSGFCGGIVGNPADMVNVR